tara:strand:+ start:290 stop:529 length:240 start_codon:yes stop_codon:yes gene_type:complete
MKKTILTLFFVLALGFNAESCPYQKMAEVDTKLQTQVKNVKPETFSKINSLRLEGEKKLRIGELSKAEEIFDRALALLK